MFTKNLGVLLMLSVLSHFDTVLGQTCAAYTGTCSYFYYVTYPCYGGFSTCYHKYVVNYECHRTEPCVFGNWGEWGSWTATSACSVTCCTGTQNQVRTRVCPPGVDCQTGFAAETQVGPCGSNNDQCPATCGVADAFLPDTCVTCGTRFYTCNGAGAGTESFCTGALVWSQTLMSCVPANICT